MSFSYRTIVSLLTVVIIASLIKLAFFALPEEERAPELSAQEIRQDLYILLAQIEQHSAFYALEADDITQQLAETAALIAEQYQDIVSNDRFAAEVTKLLYRMKDPGAQVVNFEDNSGDLPLILRPVNVQWLALDTKNNPINPDFPFITHIDGLPISKWISASQAYLPESAKDSQEMQLPWLKKLNLLREDLGLSIKPYVLVTLMNDDLQTQQVTIALAPKRNSKPEPIVDRDDERLAFSFDEFLTQLAKFEPEISSKPIYKLESVNTTTARLKIDDLYAFELDKSLQQELIKGMEQTLLIVDLREASGFSPQLLTMLSRYQDIESDNTPLSTRQAPSNIMGFAHYRRSTAFRNDYLQPLNFRPLESLGFSSPKLKILTRNLPKIDEDKFSPWFVRTKPDVEAEGNNRLVLLLGPRCRQECEWIAYRTKTWSRVNLIGERTSGDFARQYHFTLPNSGLNVRFSTSLTYDPKGQLLSGKGTEPDISLPQNNDIEWQGLVSLVKTSTSKQPTQHELKPKLAQTHSAN
ncbi:S41 family peptidase [Shewanella profunda]|uniref:S41 family peptidase n=1 Tax=Shewanella profunda TaxID=254793 RepID=UPI00200C3E4E|nr:S41 family peptidase [Shewanella profunda]MCL1090658.1 S41 family peptidase [Shewanella profunda]